MNSHETSLIHPQTLLAACGGDPLLLQTMIRSYREHFGRHLETMSDAMMKRDAVRTREAAHKLRGLVSTFSTRASDAVAALERLENDAPAASAAQFDTVANMLRSLAAALATVTVGHLAHDAGIEIGSSEHREFDPPTGTCPATA
jgi:hypothetical protein